jgi:phenylacetic acid degradation operon negative regulatory protein
VSADKEIQAWIRRALRADPPRSKSLMVTVLGDSIAPRARGLWLSELIQLMRPFRVNERLVRTTTFRLSEEGWLQPERKGRRSRYMLTGLGMERILHAQTRIYEPPPRTWSGVWTVVILGNAGYGLAERAAVRRELEWEGFGMLAPGIACHPCADRDAVSAILDRHRLTDSAIVLEARDLDSAGGLPSRGLIAECWKLEQLANLYAGFVSRFQSVLPLAERAIEAQTAFVVQTLLIHAWRRIVLHDPRFPVELLPADWPGQTAFEVCRGIYQRTFEPAQKHVTAHLSGEAAYAGAGNLAGRFGGL